MNDEDAISVADYFLSMPLGYMKKHWKPFLCIAGLSALILYPLGWEFALIGALFLPLLIAVLIAAFFLAVAAIE